jgi:uncharacterized protein
VHYLLIYDIAPDYVERRGEYRNAHLERADASVSRGELVLGGAVGEPPESALLLFRCASPETAEAFAKSDPYVLNGLVTAWRVRPWNTVVGPDAENPVRIS